MPTPTKLAIVGTGNIGQQHIQQITSGAVSNAVVTAVVSRNKPAELSSYQHYTSIEQLLAADVCDAVLVATPTYHHLEAGLAILATGKHLLMEKPLGLSTAEAQQLIDATGEQQFAVMLNQRMNPVFGQMKRIIDSGQLGAIQRTHWTMTNWFRPEIYFAVSDWRATWRGEGGGLLLNQCIHNLDVFQWLCGMPSKVLAQCQFGQFHNIEVEDQATAYFEYPNGATGVFVGSTGEAPGINRLDIVGDLGTLNFDDGVLSLALNSPGTAEYCKQTNDMFGQPSSTVSHPAPPEACNQHALILQNFIDAIQHGTPLITPAEEGLHSLALANAILLSSWQNTAVNLPLDNQQYQTALDAKIAQSSLRQKQNRQANIDMNQSFR